MCVFDWNLLFNGITAACALAAVLIAIFTDWFRRKHRLKLTFDKQIHIAQDGRIYFHIIVLNKKTHLIAKNCRVQLIDIYKKLSNKKWEKLAIGGDYYLAWQFEKGAVDLIYQNTLDFLVVKPNEARLTSHANISSFNDILESNKDYLFSMIAISEAYKSDVFNLKVYWNGDHSLDKKTMAGNYSINEISKSELKKMIRIGQKII